MYLAGSDAEFRQIFDPFSHYAEIWIDTEIELMNRTGISLIVSAFIIAALTGVLLPSVRADEAVEGQSTVTAHYTGSILIFKVGEITLSAQFADDRYIADTHLRAAGLAALFTDFDIRAQVSGQMDSAGPRPSTYSHVERTGSKVRAVAMSFDGDIAAASASPPFGSLGDPAASAEQRTGTIDPMSAVFFLSTIHATDLSVCSGRIPVFDGKARYDLRLENNGLEQVRTAAWRGDAVVCQVWYEPIAGYDPEDYPSDEELTHPLTIWLAPFNAGRLHVPVRIHTRAGYGGVTIEARRIDVT
jgi:hypothetical protein